MEEINCQTPLGRLPSGRSPLATKGERKINKKIVFAISGNHISLLMNLWTNADIAALKKANMNQLFSRAAASKNRKVSEWLISIGALATHGWHILTLAAKNGNIELMDAILSSKPEMLRQLNNVGEGTQVIADAIRNGQLSTVAYLIDKGASPVVKMSSSSGLNIIQLAADQFQLEILQLLKKRFPTEFEEDITAKSPRTLLNFSIYHNAAHVTIDKKIQVYKWLVENGCMSPCSEASALHLAAESANMEFLKYLVEDRKINTNVHYNYGIGPLAYAHNEQVIQYLIDHGANINALDRNNAPVFAHHKNLSNVLYFLALGIEFPPASIKVGVWLVNLYSTATNGPDLLEITKQIVARGIPINSISDYGICMLHYSHRFSDYLPLVEWLLKNGIDVNKEDYFGDTPLNKCCARIADIVPLIKLLHEYGADVNKPNKIDMTPVITCIRNRNLNNLRKLLELGATMKFRTSTALHYAAEQAKGKEACKILIEFGADIHARDSLGKAPYELSDKSMNRFWKAILDKEKGKDGKGEEKEAEEKAEEKVEKKEKEKEEEENEEKV